jgi:hypothetical protein
VTLTLIRVVKTEHYYKSSKDNRHRVMWTVAAYRGTDGEEYRKSFEAKGKLPTVPETGTHATLNAQQYQW